MMEPDVRCVPVSETSVMLYLADEIDVSLAPLIGRICRRIREGCPEVCELTPSYGSILVQVHAVTLDLDALARQVLEMARQESAAPKPATASVGKCIELPVYYHSDVAPDLESVAEAKGLSVDRLIEIHSGRDYTVCAIGFAPGFAFLADVDERIATPRHESPRAKVSAGSVGIAEKQTAVYPADTPGGWQLIGKCPVSLYDPREVPLSPFEVGDRVRFVPVDLAEFIERGGRV
jgi:KipI family sensor histidine kinase inhibitor